MTCCEVYHDVSSLLLFQSENEAQVLYFTFLVYNSDKESLLQMWEMYSLWFRMMENVMGKKRLSNGFLQVSSLKRV